MSGRKGNKSKVVGKLKPDNSLQLNQNKDETEAQAVARSLLAPEFRHGFTASRFAGELMSGSNQLPGLMDFYRAVEKNANAAAAGAHLSLSSRILMAQALTLDSMFTELARRAQLNMGQYINAAERYARLALKSQANCRATLEALAKLHQPREQIVRHVHVNEGGKAVIADEFHNHQGGGENAKSDEQSHATGASGESAALPCPDPLRDPLPSPSRTR